MDVNESQVPRVEILMQVRDVVPQSFFLKKLVVRASLGHSLSF